MAIPWHRIFGMALTQYFAGTAWRVDVESICRCNSNVSTW
jgi:hypothetical protein